MEYEKEVKFVRNLINNMSLQSKRGIIDFIEEAFSEEASDDKKNLWDLKLNKEEIKVYVKKSGGSKFNSQHPYVKTEILFNSSYEMRKVIEAVRLLFT